MFYAALIWLMGKRKRKKRGFAICVLVGFAAQAVHFWRVFSESVRHYKTLRLPRKWKNASDKDIYRFYEDVLDLLRPIMDEGLKSILLAAPRDKDWTDGFLEHIHRHHRWLVGSRGNNQASFGQVVGSAHSLGGVRYLLEQEPTQAEVNRITSEEAYYLTKALEKSINVNAAGSMVLYGLKEIEKAVYEGGKKDDSVGDRIDYLLLTDEFLDNHPNKGRIYRLKQIAENKGIITKVVVEDSPAGGRIEQFGGIICFKTIGFY